VIPYFDELGRRLHETWRAKRFDHEAFTDLAVSAMVENPAHATTSFVDVLRLLGSDTTLPLQMPGSFGEPPVTLFRTERFYIEALFWLDGTTAIHQHGFSGAFQLLEGSSLHCAYDFAADPGARLNANLLGGALALRHAEVLARGDTRPIREGARGVHSLFHLDAPTVTIVARTVSDPGEPQYNFQRPGLAYNPYARTTRTARLVESLRFLHELRHPELVAIAREHIARAESLEAYFLIEKMFAYLEEDGFALLLDAVADAHPLLVPSLRPVFAQRRVERRLLARRKAMRHPDDRFVVALVLAAESGADVLRLARARYGEAGGEARARATLTRLRGAAAGDPLAMPLAELRQGL
jgi:hypothetical protein